ncbi:MAG TPA: cupredoxin domain-containing protein [Ilumatobacteraceae bacterium]|jgi:plastocyanin|nr:cupredoxin domain-containing protein [Ilumatobacteraceae bacterium]
MRYRFVLLAVLLPAFAACSSDSGSGSSSAPTATTQPTVSATAGTAAAATTTTVVVAAATTATSPTSEAAGAGAGAVGIADFKFDPPTVNVPVGGTVVWTNNDTQQHTATSAGNFDAGAIQPGSTATVEFKTAGTFAYICSFHPFMMGTVVVG